MQLCIINKKISVNNNINEEKTNLYESLRIQLQQIFDMIHILLIDKT